MKLLLDTHALLWYAYGDDRLPPKVRELIESDTSACLLSMASLWEMAIKMSLGKLEIPGESLQSLAGVATASGVQILELTVPHLEAVVDLPIIHRDPFDRLLVVQAQLEGLELVSRDRQLDAYGIRRIWR